MSEPKYGHAGLMEHGPNRTRDFKTEAKNWGGKDALDESQSGQEQKQGNIIVRVAKRVARVLTGN